MDRARNQLVWIGGVLLLGLVAVAGVVALLSDELPDGPTPVAWDHDACAKCGMHVGEPAFAAQVQLRDGRTLHYDDPGCLLLDDAATGPDVHAIWFHHHREDRWLRGERAAFVEVAPTPMGFGLGAVDAAPGTLPLAAARDHALRSHRLGLEEP